MAEIARVAVQMDPIERINIAGDSTFALLLEAQGARPRNPLLHARPAFAARLRRGGDSADAGRPRHRRRPFHTGRRRATIDLRDLDVVLLRQDPPFDLSYITSTHLLERIAPETLVVNDPASVRNAPEKLFVMNFPELMPPTLITRDRAAIDAFRAEHGEVVMKPLHGHGGAAVFACAEGPELRLAVRPVLDDLPRALGRPALPARGERRATSASFWSMAQPRGAVNRVPAENDIRSNMVRGGAARSHGTDPARTRDLRDHRPGTEAARPDFRRHRRHRRLSDRNQRDLADRRQGDQAARRSRSGRGDLGCDRGEERTMNVQDAPASQGKWNGPHMDLPIRALIDRARIDAEIAGLAGFTATTRRIFARPRSRCSPRRSPGARLWRGRSWKPAAAASPAPRISPMSRTS